MPYNKNMQTDIEIILEKYIFDFKKRIFPDVPFNADICDKMYFTATKLAYNDAKRALKGITENATRRQEKETALVSLSNKVKQYFENDLVFSHQDFCDVFMSAFNDYKITYGAAQKIVNLTFKYLYCFDKFRNRYYKKFNDCQMVLDSFILSWFKRNVDLNNKVHIRHNETWSGMEDYNRYTAIQKLIAAFVFNKHLGLTTLEYEFILWPNTILYESAISWMSTINGIDRSETYKIYSFNNLDVLIQKIGTSCFSYNIDKNLKTIL